MTDWADRNDPTVAEALAMKCSLCKALPGQDCHNIVNGGPLPGGRVIHFFRIEVAA